MLLKLFKKEKLKETYNYDNEYEENVKSEHLSNKIWKNFINPKLLKFFKNNTKHIKNNKI